MRAQEALDEAAREFREDGWDGYGAAAISTEALIFAKRIIEALPTDIPDPEIGADPDGEVSLVWYGRADNLFCLSVGPKGVLSYAWRIDDRRGHGQAAFLDAEIPPVILREIREATG